MKRIISLGGIVALLGLSAPVFAETTVASVTVLATATVTGVNNLTANVKLISNNAAATKFNFGSVSPAAGIWANKPLEYVTLAVDDNALAWRLRTYTDNFAAPPSTTTWGYNFGGLKGQVAGAKVAMGWKMELTPVAGGPTTGDPANPASGWTFLKDRQDYNDPTTPTNDESFVGSDGVGYTNIAFGSASNTRIVQPLAAGGSTELATRTTPFQYYVEANFNGAGATNYDGTVKLDLINQ